MKKSERNNIKSEVSQFLSVPQDFQMSEDDKDIIAQALKAVKEIEEEDDNSDEKNQTDLDLDIDIPDSDDVGIWWWVTIYYRMIPFSSSGV